MAADGAAVPVAPPGDPLVARGQQVQAAVVALRVALGDEAARPRAKGAAAMLRRHVDKWERTLKPDAAQLAVLPRVLRDTGQRLPDEQHKAAYSTFTRAVDVIRKSFRAVAPAAGEQRVKKPSRAQTLSAEVRAAPALPRLCPVTAPSLAGPPCPNLLGPAPSLQPRGVLGVGPVCPLPC